MIVNAKVSNLYPIWLNNGFLPHYQDIDKHFRDQELTLKYDNFANKIEVFLSKEDAKNIYLIKLVDEVNYGTRFFYKSNISTFTQNEFKVDFYEDTKLTYYYLLFNNENFDFEKSAWSTRNSQTSLRNLNYVDDMLNFDYVSNVQILENEFPKYHRNPQGVTSTYEFKNSQSFTYNLLCYEDDSLIQNANLAFVFSGKTSGDTKDATLYILPILKSEQYKVNGKKTYLAKDNGTSFTLLEVNNSFTELQDLYLNEPSLTNQFMGIYWIPNYLNFKSEQVAVVTINRKNYAALRFFNEQEEIDFSIKIADIKEESPWEHQAYIYNNQSIKYFNQELKGKSLINKEDNNLVIKFKGQMTIANGFCLNLYPTTANRNVLSNDFKSTSIELPTSISFLSNKFIEYLNANRATLDTTYSIAKQNMNFGIASSLYGGINSILGGALKGSSLLVGQGLGEAGFASYRNVLDFNQTEAKLKASLIDKQNSTKNTLISTQNESNMLLLYMINNKQSNILLTDFKLYSRCDFILNNYGYYAPQYVSFLDIKQNLRFKDNITIYDEEDMLIKISKYIQEIDNNITPALLTNIVKSLSILKIKKKE